MKRCFYKKARKITYNFNHVKCTTSIVSKINKNLTLSIANTQKMCC